MFYAVIEYQSRPHVPAWVYYLDAVSAHCILDDSSGRQVEIERSMLSFRFPPDGVEASVEKALIREVDTVPQVSYFFPTEEASIQAIEHLNEELTKPLKKFERFLENRPGNDPAEREVENDLNEDLTGYLCANVDYLSSDLNILYDFREKTAKLFTYPY